MPLFYSISHSPLQNEIPLSLYIHIPWYVKKCPYCDFNSHEKSNTFDKENYLRETNKDTHKNNCRKNPGVNQDHCELSILYPEFPGFLMFLTCPKVMRCTAKNTQ